MTLERTGRLTTARCAATVDLLPSTVVEADGTEVFHRKLSIESRLMERAGLRLAPGRVALGAELAPDPHRFHAWVGDAAETLARSEGSQDSACDANGLSAS
jgi:hypothetical protein